MGSKMGGREARLEALVLEAHPFATVLVDRARRVVYANAAARKALGAREGQDLAECFECGEHAAGRCGTGSRCRRCPVEAVVAGALSGKRGRGRTFLLRSRGRSEPADLHVLLAGAPAERDGAPHAVLTLLDVNEVLADPDVLRVCAGCGRIEEDGEWYPLDRYLEDRLGLEAGEALCPECSRPSRRR